MRTHSIGLTAVVISIAAAGAPAVAQTPLEPGLRIGPQFMQYEIADPIGVKISEFSVPLFAVVPITRAFAIDVGTAYASAEVKATDGSGASSRINGLTDTQLRGSYTFGADAVVLSLGLNLPTGKSTATLEQLPAATYIGSDFLAFPVTNMGTGFGVTGGLAVARPLGNWNVGFGASVRHASAYDPLDDDGTGTRLRYEPGDEYRGRLGVDRLVGNGRLTMGLTYSAFANDKVSGTTYNSGDRFIGQISYGGVAGPGELTLAVWDLYRASGELAGTETGSDQIANVLLAYGLRAGGAVIEPSVEYRNWQAEGSSTSSLVNLGLRTVFRAGPVAVVPAVRYATGGFGAGGSRADLTGWHGILSIGVGR